MLKFVTFAGVAAAAFIMPAMVNAATFPSAQAAIVAASPSMTAPNSNLRNIILDQPDHRDNGLGTKNGQSNNPYAGNSGKDPGRAPSGPGGGPSVPSSTPEPNSLALFAVGLSGLILLESGRRAWKRRQSVAGSNSSI